MPAKFRITREGAPISLGEWVSAAGRQKNLRLHSEASVVDGYMSEAIVVKQIRGDLDLILKNNWWRKLRGKSPRLVPAFDFANGEANFEIRANKWKGKEPIKLAAEFMARDLDAQIVDRDGRLVYGTKPAVTSVPESETATPGPAESDKPQTD